MANLRQRANLWIKGGFTVNEARELAPQYSIQQMRSLPYLIRMRRTRYLYRVNLASHGYGEAEIIRSLQDLYVKKGWLDESGMPDVWRMLRSYRKQILDSGGNPSPGLAPHRSHHSRKEITQAELNAQRRQIEKQREINEEIFGK